MNVLRSMIYLSLAGYMSAPFAAEASFAPIVVGAPYEDSLASQPGSDSAPNSGAVYLKWKTLQGQLGTALIKAPNAESSDKFGEAAILSGNNQVLLVGAPGESGCGANVGATKHANLIGTNSRVTCFSYGMESNADSGNPLDSVSIGAAYVFEGQGQFANNSQFETSAGHKLLDFTTYIKAPNPSLWDNFGGVVHISGDGKTIAIAATGEDNCGIGVGGTGVNPNQRLGGHSVCGQYVNPGMDDNSARDSGAVYIYKKRNNTWVLDAYLKAPNTDPGDMFGSALALDSDGDQLLVGTPGEDNCGTGVGGQGANANQRLGYGSVCGTNPNPSLWDNSARDSGAVYHYARENGQWVLKEYIKASNTDAGDLFGSALSFDHQDNKIVIGAPGESGCSAGIDGALPNPNKKINGESVCGNSPLNSNVKLDNRIGKSGAVYVFAYDDNNANLKEVAYIKAPNPDANDQFGANLFIDSVGGLMIGAPGEDNCGTHVDGTNNKAPCQNPGLTNNQAQDAGAAYVYNDNNYANTKVAYSFFKYVKAPSVHAGDVFGTNLAAVTALDVQDPTIQMVFSAPGYDKPGMTDTGKVFVYTKESANKLRKSFGFNGKLPNVENSVSNFDYFGGSALGGSDTSVTSSVGNQCTIVTDYLTGNEVSLKDFIDCIAGFGPGN
ncbi:FG-GAP repeat protein [Vibrio europaeus]|uniref:hypothetical protein n=1 Tax=Vibrio europaeus TaxID=300876 RepID=UPI00233F1989|nr:hypothetical protein [Vibrio europaeus]MDC5870376.1 FG-GAP repeat protein [Vibrio europaeus]